MVDRLRKSRVTFWSAVAALIVVAAAAAFVAVQYATAAELGELQPPDGATLRSSEVMVVAALPGFEPGSAQVEMLIDAEPVPPDRLKLVRGAARAAVTLRDGSHWARVTLSSRNLFSRRIVARWSFVVDTTAPSITVTDPLPITAFSSASTRLSLVFREPVQVQLLIDGEQVPFGEAGASDGGDAGAASASGALEVGANLHLPPGRHSLAVTATDKAGNVTTKTWTAWVDFQAPQATPVEWPEKPWDEPRRELALRVNDDQPDGLEVKVQLDGTPLYVASEPTPDGADARTYLIDTGDLAEGEHVVEYRVADRGANTQSGSYTFLVDSTESFGQRPMGPGAEGRDVTTLQQILRRKGLLEGKTTGTFDMATSQAIVAFKVSHGLPAEPTLDLESLAGLLGRIVIDRSERRLYLYDGDTLLKTYPVAVGQPRYPTPTGKYRIVNRVSNPTWSPPPSPWADGLEPVPPGPDNPLGTRWMGLSAPHVGIHGTYNSSSVGTAASHGCIRMYIRDVEDLFDRVYVGTPVDIVS